MISTTVYVSTLHHALTPTETDDLLARSRDNNARNQVSGMLTVRGRHVMQVLEGDAPVIKDLFARISGDSRHANVTTVWTSTHPDRRYPGWSMGFDNLDDDAPDGPSALAWPGPSLAALPAGDERSSDSADYVTRRARVVRRALYSGNRLMTTLAIILDGHRPDIVLDPDGVTRFRCAECRLATGDDQEHYPCPTAKNAIWALESALPR